MEPHTFGGRPGTSRYKFLMTQLCSRVKVARARGCWAGAGEGVRGIITHTHTGEL